MDRSAKIHRVARQLAYDLRAGHVRNDVIKDGKLPDVFVRQFMSMRCGQLDPPLTIAEAVAAFEGHLHAIQRANLTLIKGGRA